MKITAIELGLQEEATRPDDAAEPASDPDSLR